MIRHLLKLVWNRKRANALLIVEILVSFLLLFAVTAGGVYHWRNSRMPIGFSWQDVWAVNIETGRSMDEADFSERARAFERVFREAQQAPRVREAAGVDSLPFDMGGSSYSIDAYRAQTLRATDTLASVLELELVAGRWFEPADEAMDWKPVVIDRDLATHIFGSDDPVGRALPTDPDDTVERRIVGVVDDFREDGELSAPGNYIFRRKSLAATDERPLNHLLLAMEPGTTVEAEPEILRRLRMAAPEWSFEIRPLAQLRETGNRVRILPVVVGSVVAAFLLLMVGLGLVGVMWQNVTQRTRELGLRRALGASRRSVHRQVLWELCLLATLGVALGIVLLVQLPLLDLVGFVDPFVFTLALLLSTAGIYGLAVASGLYPSLLATRIEVADAMRSE